MYKNKIFLILGFVLLFGQSLHGSQQLQVNDSQIVARYFAWQTIENKTLGILKSLPEQFIQIAVLGKLRNKKFEPVIYSLEAGWNTIPPIYWFAFIGSCFIQPAAQSLYNNNMFNPVGFKVHSEFYSYIGKPLLNALPKQTLFSAMPLGGTNAIPYVLTKKLVDLSSHFALHNLSGRTITHCNKEAISFWFGAKGNLTGDLISALPFNIDFGLWSTTVLINMACNIALAPIDSEHEDKPTLKTPVILEKLIQKNELTATNGIFSLRWFKLLNNQVGSVRNHLAFTGIAATLLGVSVPAFATIYFYLTVGSIAGLKIIYEDIPLIPTTSKKPVKKAKSNPSEYEKSEPPIAEQQKLQPAAKWIKINWIDHFLSSKKLTNGPALRWYQKAWNNYLSVVHSLVFTGFFFALACFAVSHFEAAPAA
jgi:hypothetical protein